VSALTIQRLTTARFESVNIHMEEIGCCLEIRMEL
jgi:hypothetical protein